jgi:CHAD domain-containing protein
VQRSLRRLGRATNEGRDAEVRLAWIARERKALPREERRGSRRAVRRLRAARKKGYGTAKGRVQKDYTRAAERLVRRLEQLESVGPSLSQVIPPLVRRQAAELEVRLAAVRDGEDREGAHGARIAGKRLRYLIEPIAKESSETGFLLDRLKALHGLLGKINDLYLVMNTLDQEVARLARAQARRLRKLADHPAENGDGPPSRRSEALMGVEALAALARAQKESLFAELERRWLGGRGRRFFRDTEALAQALAGKAGDDAPPATEKEQLTVPELKGVAAPKRSPVLRASRRRKPAQQNLS